MPFDNAQLPRLTTLRKINTFRYLSARLTEQNLEESRRW